MIIRPQGKVTVVDGTTITGDHSVVGNCSSFFDPVSTTLDFPTATAARGVVRKAIDASIIPEPSNIYTILPNKQLSSCA